MWPLHRPKKRPSGENFQESVAYENIKSDKTGNLVMLYDEATILLFEKPKSKSNIKKL